MWFSTFVYYMTRCRGRYDVVVAEGFGGSRVPRLSPLYVTEPMITEWHQIHRDLFAVQYPRLMNPALNLLERATAWVHRDTLVRAGTEDWRRNFTKFGFRPANVFVLPVSIRDERLERSSGGPSTEPRILWLGKLRRYKCPDHAVRAMKAVLEHVPEARLTIAGRRDDLKYEAELRALARELGIEKSVDFRFDLTENEKWDLIRASRILVVTSAVEGFGIVVLEANAYGIPVVASTGVPEGAVQDGGNGLRYPFGDVPALAKKLSQLLQDGELYSRLSQNASKGVEQYRWTRVGAEFERVVSSAAARAGSRR